MDVWIVLWKGVFILGIAAFTVLFVVVSIGGYSDIKRLFQSLNKS